MASKKIYTKLPAILQTTPIKNFFESTVEQMFSKANTESINGFVGNYSFEDFSATGTYIPEATATRRFYGLTPVVNTINAETGLSENLIFFDEMIDTLATYGVDVRNQNKLFGENYASFLPPIDIDKFVNYQEYYWFPDGPTTIKVEGTLSQPIDIDRDVIGQLSFTPPNGKSFRNGMIVEFVGGYVIPESKTGIEYVVQGVGSGIFFVPKERNFSTRFSTPDDNLYDASNYSLSDANIAHSAASISSVVIKNAGIGYVAPVVQFTGANTVSATGNVTLNANGSVASVGVVSGGSEYSGAVGVQLIDVAVQANVVAVYEADGVTDADLSGTSPIVANKFRLDSTANVLVGQTVTSSLFTGLVTAVSGTDITLDETKTFIGSEIQASPEFNFAGRNFDAEVRLDLMATVVPGAVTILNSQVVAGIDPNTGQYYLIGGEYAFDRDINNDGEGDLPWGGSFTQATPDYLLQARGAANNNVWSRVNFWYHRDNFLDAGQPVPAEAYRARRQIIEFDRNIELFNHGTRSIGAVTVASTALNLAQVTNSISGSLIDDTPVEDATVIFPNEDVAVAKYIYQLRTDLNTGLLTATRIPDPVLNPAGAVDGDANFVPWTMEPGDVIQITSGALNIGKEFYFTTTGWQLAQEKLTVNQAPLFNLYDDKMVYLGDTGVYPQSDFEGSKLFSYKVNTAVNAPVDEVLGFPLSYKPYKASSEIEYENNITADVYTYVPFGSTRAVTIPGYKFYKQTNGHDSYQTSWRTSINKNVQRIRTAYVVDQFDVDSQLDVFYVGAVPDASTATASGYDIIVTVNGALRTDFEYVKDVPGYIKFSALFNAGDFVDISVGSDTGLLNTASASKYELPISWREENPGVTEISSIAQPEYLQHFRNYMQAQPGFEGDALGRNNFDNIPHITDLARDIVHTDQNLALGAFLVAPSAHNLVDALRFNAREYEKYKNRLKKEIADYYANYDTATMSNEQILERVLRNLIAFKVGADVFNRTYVIPFGDNYSEESFTTTTSVLNYTLTAYADLNTIENSLLVYRDRAGVRSLLVVDQDYTISSFNPITVSLTTAPQFNDIIVTKLYNAERDSAQCPPTPSTMGLYPLYNPAIISDTSFQDPIDVILGHDGSRTPAYGDKRDQILLEFEKRVYNAAKAEFRIENSLPSLNFTSVKPGAFRKTGFENREWNDLLRHGYTAWLVNSGSPDGITNSFFDENNEWTWNYRGDADLPGHWRGWYEYYYDSHEPHVAPWEMLGFFEKPLWWESQYGTDYSSGNTALWRDLELGIIRQGPRENVSNDAYLIDNPFAREGLHLVVPVDSNGALRSPYDIISTGSTTRVAEWTSNDVDSSQGYATTSFLNFDGVQVSYDTSNIYVQGQALVNHAVSLRSNEVGYNSLIQQAVSYALPRTVTAVPSALPNAAVAVLVNGLPLFNTREAASWGNQGDWHYNKSEIESHSELEYGHVTASGLMHYYNIEPVILGLTEWNSTQHSPIVGWAFDGLPIYGPYGYAEYDSNGQVVNSDIAPIKSAFKLRTGERTTGPGGAYTGVFVEDYEFDTVAAASPGTTQTPYNTRYGVTPDSPTTPIHFYVATIDDAGKPMFPYAVGGGVTTQTNSAKVWGNSYYGTALDVANNTLSNGTLNVSATPALTSTVVVEQSYEPSIANQWRFGDGSPVEHAWQCSEGYPFAVAEALLLSKPGEFAVSFADPVNLERLPANPTLLVSKQTRGRWNYANASDFKIHGDVDGNGNFVTNIGYTQFVNSWIKFQGLDQTVDFANKLRTLNTKLGHRMAGFVDKDTMTVRTDQYSTTGNATSLIIPNENITVQVHSSPYKTRNVYTGVVVEKVANGYKVRGYDKALEYFTVLESNKQGRKEIVSVGGELASYIDWLPNVPFKKGTVVNYLGGFYQAPRDLLATTTFDKTVWVRLSKLPLVGGAKATLYKETTGATARVDYETVFRSADDVYDFLISLGRYQSSIGFDLNQYDPNVKSDRGWVYSASQFLIWTTSRWENGNTIELSPMAPRVRFVAPLGFVAEIKRVDRDQFSLMDETGAAINPTECEIVRQGNVIEIAPPTGRQLYAVTLYTKEIEHAMTVDNVTVFNDSIFVPSLNQAQSRLKIKATRTANWNGSFTSEGFIITNDQLRPNLDNMAETMGRYHELGFMPVERNLYEAARALFGFQERDYLRELDISDDAQFEFYKGMLQNKGTALSLSRIANSNAIVQGNVTVFDEWALRVADFGDTENNQSIELKLEKVDVVNDPQLITLAFPEDVTGIVQKVDVIEQRYTYYTAPSIAIAAPTATRLAVQATAEAILDSSGRIDRVVVTNPGQGYNTGALVGVTVIAGNVEIDAVDTSFSTASVLSSDWIGNVTALTSITLTDNFGNANVVVDLTSANVASDIADLINSDAALNGNVTAQIFSSTVIESNVAVEKYTLELTGKDFTVEAADTNLYIAPGRYQPRQRYAIDSAKAVTDNNITVTVDGIAVPNTQWAYDPGERWTTLTTVQYQAGDAPVFVLGAGTEYGETAIETENLALIDGAYAYLTLSINGVEIANRVLNGTSYDTVWSATTGTLTVNIAAMPNSVKQFSPSLNQYVLPAGTEIKLVERATIDFEDTFQGDLPGSVLRIVVSLNDGIAIKLGTKRIYEITPDAKDDDIILIDIDDATRFLKKPQGVRDFKLWPTTRNVDHTGITDSKYVNMPNAGYVHPADVNFQAYDIASLPDLFGSSTIVKPAGGHLIHMAASENNDWNVYRLSSIDSPVSFLLQGPSQSQAKLYTTNSLFNFIDSNMIGEPDTGRYLDYYLTLKNANVSDNVVVWTNERVVQQKQADLQGVKAPRMIEARIRSIGPHPDSILPIAAVTPVATKSYNGLRISNADASNTVTVSGLINNGIKENDAVTISANSGTYYFSAANVAFVSAGNVVVTSTNPVPAEFTAPSHITLFTSGNATASGKQYYVASANATAFVVADSYFANANVVAGLGNVNYALTVLPDYNGGNVDLYYVATNVTATSFQISGPELAGIVSGAVYTSTATAFWNSAGNITLTSAQAIPPSFVTPGNITLFATGDANANAKVYYVESVNTVNNTIVVKDSYFANANVVTGLGNVSYSMLTPSTINVRHMNRSRISTVDAHGLGINDTVRIIANAFTGTYTVRSVPDSNTIEVDAPYSHSSSQTGNVFKRGMQIRTTDLHGITPEYINSGKRVAVHFASPSIYNDVYYVDTVSPDTLNIFNRFPVSAETEVFFDRAQGYANVSANVISINENSMLTDVTVIYTANMQLVAPNAYTVNSSNVVFGNDILSNTMIGFTIIRDLEVEANRYPSLTTLDHNKVRLNGAELTVGNFNSAEGTVAAINRDMNLRRAMVTTDNSNQFSMKVNILTDYNTEVPVPIGLDALATSSTSTSTAAPAYRINNYGPYVKDQALLNTLAGAENITGSLTLSTPDELVVDPEYNLGSIKVGPVYGMQYTDSTSGVNYLWNLELSRYMPVTDLLELAETDANPIEVEATDSYGIDAEISDGTDVNPTALTNETALIADEDPVQLLPASHVDGGAIATVIPGSGTVVPNPATTMGRKWPSYNMTATRGGAGDSAFDAVAKPRWTLTAIAKPTGWAIEVYERVKNSAGDKFWILVDVTYPPTVPHDFFATLAAYSDFENLPIEDYYYNTDTAFTGTGLDLVSAKLDYIPLPPVEPAFYVGRQLIPEPFAVSGGNGTDAFANWKNLPPLTIGADVDGGETKINMYGAGYNSFFMWVPGLTSGQWEPNQSGPGKLPGAGGFPVHWGYGRGYYADGDLHRPASAVAPATSSGPYPGFNAAGWTTRQPRFKYSKDFTVFPTSDNYVNEADILLNSSADYSNPAVKKVRPEEIFVACFWTEPFTYVNQLRGYDYKNLTADGNPAPIYEDYQGTVTRVKYIRLTELPTNAVLRRPIPDTGWAGKGWKNLTTDAVQLPGEYSPAPGDTNNPWATFDLTSVPSGSTGTGNVVTTTPVPVTATLAPAGGTGLGRVQSDLSPGFTAPLVQGAPVLTAAALASLPGPCAPTQNPVVRPPDNAPCYAKPAATAGVLKVELDANALSVAGNVVHEVHDFKVVGKKPFTVFFDFSKTGTLAQGITIEQSSDPTFADSTKTRFIVDTQSTPEAEGGQFRFTDGSQIGKYGTDLVPGLNTVFLTEVNEAFGVGYSDVYANPLTVDRPRAYGQRKDLPDTMPEGNYLGVKGFGFIQRSIDCRNGEYVRVTVSKGIGNTTGKYQLYVIYNTIAEDEVPLDENGSLATCEFKNAPSRAYRDGAKAQTFTYGSTKTSSFLGTGLFKKTTGKGAGYFGTDSKDMFKDNIYYPYGSFSSVSSKKTANGGNGKKVASEAKLRTMTLEGVPSYTTVEFKGYYYAPVSGTYTFQTTSDDASWVWVSPKDDLSGDEYYKANGQRQGDPKNYTHQNAVVKNGGIQKGAQQTQSGTITLEGGKYYFIRGIYGNRKDKGELYFRVKVPGTSSFVDVEFTGRKCPTDAGYVPPGSSTSPTAPIVDTPIYNPAPGIDPNVPAGYVGGGTGVSIGNAPINYWDYAGTLGNPVTFGDIGLPQAPIDRPVTYGNFSGYSQPAMTGYSFMPSSFKRQGATVVDPQKYGFSVDLEGGRFVNATSQRVTGGFVIPLARTVETVSRTPRQLNSQTLTAQPWYKSTPINLNQTFRDVTYSPKRIGSTFTLNGVAISNVVGTTSGQTTTGTGIILTPTGPSIPGTGVPNTNGTPVNTGGSGAVVALPEQNAPFENSIEKIAYNAVPTLNITPLAYDGSGRLVSAGAPAVAKIYRPTPSVSVDPYAMAAVPPNTELLLNNYKVTFRNGSSVNDIKAQINCANMGVRADVDPVSGNLVISSCSDSPFSVKNGCASGRLKQVADFHVVRGFDQSINTSQSQTINARAFTAVPGGNANIAASNNIVEWSVYDIDNVLDEVITVDSATSILPSISDTTTTTTNYSTGGRGYRVGDRLRLLGGTPVNDTKGPLTVICIDDPGYGYNNPANLKVVIGNGQTPGVGAAAIVTELDENGGVAKIEMLNYGIGYDTQDPPEIKIVDTGDNRGTYITVDATNPAGTYTRGTVMLVQSPEIVGDTVVVTEEWYRVNAVSITIGANTYPAASAVFNSAGNITVNAVNVADVANVTANTWVTLLTDGDATANNHNFYVTGVDTVNGAFTVSDAYFANANIVAGLGNVEFTVKEPFSTRGLIRVADPRLGKGPVMAHARIGVDPESVTDEQSIGDTGAAQRHYTGELLNGFKSLAGPLRVAKFLVTGVDNEGSITSIKILDRGLYKVFPSDLTMGIPLEYDYEFVGSSSTPSSALGVADPLRGNIPYGPNHPEYQQAPFVDANGNVVGKHPDWIEYQEYKFDPVTRTYVEYNGSPGGYDPLTYVYINGQMLSKQQTIDTNPLSATYGEYVDPVEISGGTGARVFLTAMEVPDCSERGNAREILGLPDSVSEINVPETLARALNNALAGAGYKPEDIRFEVDPISREIGQLQLVSPTYPGINIGGTPGFPDKLGLPTGDYLNGMLCIQATMSTPNISSGQATTELDKLYQNNAFGLTTPQGNVNYGAAGINPIVQPAILSLLCVDTFETDPNSMFGERVEYVRDLFEYDIQNIFGKPVRLLGANKQNAGVFVFESKRFENEQLVDAEADDTGLLDLTREANVWIDNYQGTGWAYLENGVVKRQQEPLVDVEYVKNAIMYNRDTGDKELNFQFWDPFKGVLPGFIRNEIHYINEVDPVNYNNARTDFGRNNVGKVWWDTSTLRYMWYEQGTNRERWLNWGRAFPGSTVTVCEWVESRALPTNYTGDGTPRWADRYVTERRLDPVTGQYVNYYYYWVQNRTVLDSRLVDKLNRQLDVDTVARYIANPVGYGINMISFVSDESFVLSNIKETVREEDSVVQINLSRNLNPEGVKHTAWKLMRENDNNSIVPEHLTDKLIDSLCGFNALGQLVPDPTLSEVERYGIAFRPRQTMFSNLSEARRVMAYTLNELMADTQIQTNFAGWDAGLPEDLVYLERVNWYAIKNIDPVTNEAIRYDASYKPVFTVNSVTELAAHTNSPDGTVIQVKNGAERAQLWQYVSATGDFKLISIAGETVRIKDSVFTGETETGALSVEADVAQELRALLRALESTVFVNTSNWNKFFFEMLKYAYMEQKQLSWAFKTSYIYVEKEEEDLVQLSGFKPDNFEKVIEYMNEVKPFTAKIREYKDGKKAPIEFISGGMISDFDKPPYADPATGQVRVLDDYNPDDVAVMNADSRYANYVSISNKDAQPFRSITTQLVFDRTNWRLTDLNYNANTTSLAMGIATNMANLNLANASTVNSNELTRAADRIFKFDPEVQAMFVTEVNAHYGNTTAGTDANVITNALALYDIVQSGNLEVTLNLVKEKVGGGYRGEILDGNLFTNFVSGLDSTYDFVTAYGWDQGGYDSRGTDQIVQVNNYEGVFNGNVTLRRFNDIYEGFDGATFKRVLVGEERPEELVQIAPMEDLVIRVWTNYPDTNTAPVGYQVHYDLFGNAEYLRLSDANSTTLASAVYSYSTEITVADASSFVTPVPGTLGVLWIGSERVLYAEKVGNTFSQLTRGASGTSVQNHAVGAPVYAITADDSMANFNTDAAVWLDAGAVSLADSANANIADPTSIMRFLNGL